MVRLRGLRRASLDATRNTIFPLFPSFTNPARAKSDSSRRNKSVTVGLPETQSLRSTSPGRSADLPTGTRCNAPFGCTWGHVALFASVAMLPLRRPSLRLLLAHELPSSQESFESPQSCSLGPGDPRPEAVSPVLIAAPSCMQMLACEYAAHRSCLARYGGFIAGTFGRT